MITDSHCHLASHKFSPDELEDLVARAHAAGVTRMITLSTGPHDLEANLAIAERFPSVQTCIGVHPCDVHEADDAFLDRIDSLAGDPRVAALGETGLDYFHPAPEGWTEETYGARQRDLLCRHFEIAARHKLNVVIHTRDRSGNASFRDALEIYRPFAKEVRAVFHCFPGTLEEAQEVIALGGLVSFGGIVTFKNPGPCFETARQLEPGTFMLETDAPYLAPVPHRGTRNEPAYTRATAEALATARGELLDALAAHTTKTARVFFRSREDS